MAQVGAAAVLTAGSAQSPQTQDLNSKTPVTAAQEGVAAVLTAGSAQYPPTQDMNSKSAVIAEQLLQVEQLS